jgi:hypothetical protein
MSGLDPNLPDEFTPPTHDCDDGCDIGYCHDCGEDFSSPCARHLAFGHHASDDVYGDGVDCGGCCPICGEAASA